jgi:hypothetical protein
MIKTPCEIILWKVLPSLRREFVKTAYKKGLSRKEISKVFGITEASVCHYLKSKRGYDFKFNKETMKEIERVTEDILSNPKNRVEALLKGSCRICTMVKGERLLCKLHSKENRLLINCCLCKG